MLDVPTLLGLVIPIGVAANDTILIVQPSLRLAREGDERGPLPPREGVGEVVRFPARPIFLGTRGPRWGVLPPGLMPGSGSNPLPRTGDRATDRRSARPPR